MGLVFKLVCTRWAGMAKTPIRGLTTDGFIDAAVNFGSYSKVDIKCDRKLAGQVLFGLELGENE
jgi:hypothetical protein